MQTVVVDANVLQCFRNGQLNGPGGVDNQSGIASK